MTQSGDNLALLHDLLADGADLIAGIAILGAGGGFSAHQFGLVTQSGDNLALLHDLLAHGADLVAGVAVLGAGGSLGTNDLGVVAGGGDDLALLHGDAADLADLIAGIAVLGAGGGLGTHQLGVVTGGGDDLALGDDFAADLADLIAGVAVLGAGGGLGVLQLGVVAHQLQSGQQGTIVVHQLLLGVGKGVVLSQQLTQVSLVLLGQILDGLEGLDLLDQLQHRHFIGVVGVGINIQIPNGCGAGLAGEAVSRDPVSIAAAEGQRGGIGIGAGGEAFGQGLKALEGPGILGIILEVGSHAALHLIDDILGVGLLGGGPGQQGVADAGLRDGQVRGREVALVHDVDAALFGVEVLVPDIGGVAHSALGIVQVQAPVVVHEAAGAGGAPQAHEVGVQGHVCIGSGQGHGGLQQRSGHAVEVVILQVLAAEEGLGADALQGGGIADALEEQVAGKGVAAHADGALGDAVALGGAALGIVAQVRAVLIEQDAVHALEVQGAVGHIDVLQAGAVVEGHGGIGDAAILDGGGQSQLRQSLAAHKAAAGHSRQGLGQGDILQIVVVSQCAAAHLGDGVGNDNGLQAGLGNGVGADAGQAVGQTQAGQIGTIVEGEGADGQPIGGILEVDLLDPGAGEGVAAHLGDAGGNDDLLQTGVVLEHLIGDLRHGGGQGELGGLVALGPDVDIAGILQHDNAVGGRIHGVVGVHHDVLQAAGQIEGILGQAGDGGGDVDLGDIGGLVVVQISKRLAINGLQGVGEGQRPGLIGLIEGAVADGLQLGAGEVQILELPGIVEGLLADGLQLRGPVDGLQQGAVIEGALTDGGDVVAELHGLDGLGVVERALGDDGEAAAVDGSGGVAVIERGAAQGGDGLGNGDGLQSLPAVEGVGADGGQALLHGQGGGLGAAAEGVIAHGLHGGGQVHSRQDGAVAEGVGGNSGQALAEDHGFQAGAAVEGVLAQGGEAIGQSNGRQLGAALEGGGADLLEAGGQRDGRDGGVLIEQVVADGLHAVGHGVGGALEVLGQAHQNLAAAGQQGAVLGPDDAGAVLDDIALKGLAADKRRQTEGQSLGLVGGGEGQGLQIGAALEGPLADEGDVVGNDEVHQRGAALEHLLADGGQLGGHEGGQVQAVVERGIKAGGIAQHGDLGEAAAGKGVGADEGQALGDHHLLQGGAAGEAAGANGGDVGQVGQVLQALAGEERRLGQLGQVPGQSHGGYSRAVGELVAVCVHRGDGVGNGDAGQGVGIIENTGAEAGDALGDHQVALQGLAEVEGLDAHGGQALGQDAVVGVAQGLQVLAVVERALVDDLHGLRQADALQVVAVVEGPIADLLQGVGADDVENVVVVLEGVLPDDADTVGNGDGALGAAVADQSVAHDVEAAGAGGLGDGDGQVIGGGAVLGLGGNGGRAGLQSGELGILGQLIALAVGLNGDHGLVGGGPLQVQVGGIEGRVGIQPDIGIGGTGQHGHGGGVQPELTHRHVRAHLVGDGDLALGLHVGPDGGLDGDGGGAGSLGGHDAVLHLGHAGIGGAPNQVLVGGVVGSHSGVQLDIALLGQGHSGLIQSDLGDGVFRQGHAIGTLVHGVVVGHHIEGALQELLIEVRNVEGVGILLVSPGRGAVGLQGGDDAVIVVGADAHLLLAVADVGLPLGGVQGGAGQAEVIGQGHIQVLPAVLAGAELQVLAVDDIGHFTVGGEVEGIGVLQVVLHVEAVHIGGGGVGHAGVVGDQVDAGQRGEDLAHIAGPHSGGAGVVHGLADIEAVAVEVHLAGVAVGDGDVGGLGRPQQTGLQVIQVADAVAAAQIHADLIGGGGGGVVALGNHEGIHAQLHHVHHGVNTGHVGGVHLLVQAVVDIGVLEDGGLGPVAVEAQEGHGQRRIVVVGQLHEAFHIDAVGELGQIRPVRVGQADGDGDGGLAVSGHGDGGAAEGAAGDLDGAGVSGEDIALLGDVQPVRGGALGLDGGIDVIGQGGAGEVLHHEAQLVHAQLVGVVAQLDLGLVLAPDIQVGGGGDGLGQVHHTGALLAGGVSHAVFIIQDVGGAHQQAVHQQLLVGIGGAGHQGIHILQSSGGHTGQIRRRHGGTAHVAVLGEGQRGIDAAAGGSDLRLQGQRRQGAPGGEVAHGHGALFGLGDGEGLFLGGFHHLAVGQADAHGGDLVVIHGHVQQIAVAVVIDDAARSAGGGGVELLLLEGQAAAHDHGDLAGDVQALVIGGVAGVGHHDVFIGFGAVIAQQQGGEVVAGHVLIGDAALGGDKGRRLVGVDGGNGQRRVIGGRGADDAGVGVGHGGEVTLCAALGGGIGVTGGAVQQDTGGLDQVVILGGQVALGLPAEAAVGAQGHIDHVHVQQQGVVQGRQDGIRGGAVGGVGEYLEDGQLGLGRLTGEGDAAVGVHGLAGGDTGHVGAVVIAVLLHGVGGGDHVGVGVGIVEGEGHLAALIQVVLGQQHQGAGAVLLGIPQSGIAVGGDVGLAVLPLADLIEQLGQAGLLQLLHGRSVGKGLVVHIQAGVQDADEHPLALILGVVGVGRHFRGGQGLAQSGGAHGIGVVGLAQHHVLYAVNILDVMDLAVRHLGGKAADHGGVAEGEGAGNALAFHGVHHGELQVGDVLQLGLGCVRLLEVQHGHTGIGAVADIQQAVCIQLHNDLDHFVVCRDLGLGHLAGVHVLLEDRQTVAVCELIGHIGGRQPGLGVRRRQFRRHGADRQDADEHHQHQDQGQQPLRHSRLFHRSTSFLFFSFRSPAVLRRFPIA